MWHSRTIGLLPVLLVVMSSAEKVKLHKQLEGYMYLVNANGHKTMVPILRPMKPIKPTSTIAPPKANETQETQTEYPIEDSVKEALRNFYPPPLSQEPNYYELKARKGTKKYSPDIKHINLKAPEEASTIEPEYFEEPEQYDPANQEFVYHLPNDQFRDDYHVAEESSYGVQATHQYDPWTPVNSQVAQQYQPVTPDYSLNSGEYMPNAQRRSVADERLNFQMHGHDGPHSYKFGYDTGKGKNRQFRLEERDKDGNVKGHFGHFDKRGKIHLTKYSSTPNGGFTSEVLS